MSVSLEDVGECGQGEEGGKETGSSEGWTVRELEFRVLHVGGV